MAADVTARVRVEGLGDFRQAMSQAAAAVKQTTAEEKRAEAQYKETGDAAAYQMQKTQALSDRLKAQEQQVKTAREAIKKLEEAKVAPDDRRLMQWKTQLANAEAEVSKTRSELGKLNGTSTAQITQGLGRVEGAAKEAGAELHGIAGKLDRETLVKGLDAVTDKMESVMRKAAQMGKAIWDASTDAANWADATRDAATAAGMTTTEYQQMAYAAQFFGLSIDDLTNKQGKLVKAMDEGGQIMVGDWAIDTIDRVTGQKRSFNNVMMDIVDGLGQIADPVARDQAAMDLFGKSYKDLNAMIEDGGKGWQEKINEAPVVREETVNSLADTADVLKEMDSRLEALKMETLAALAPSIKTIGEAVGTLAQNLTDFLQTEEGQQLLKDLGDALTEIVTAITGQDFSGLIETAKGAVEGLTGALGWLAENKDTVIAAVSGIAIAFVGLKAASAGIKAAETVSSFRRLMGIGAGNATGTPSGAPAGTGTGIGAKMAGIGTKVATFASANWWKAMPYLMNPATVLAAGILPAWMNTKAVREQRQQELDARVAQAEAEAAEIGEAADAALDIVHVTAKAMGNTGRLDISGIEVQGDLANEAAALEQLAGMDTSMLTGKQRLLLTHGTGLTNAGRHDLLESISLTAAGAITGPNAGYSGDVMGDVSDTLDTILEFKDALTDSPGSLGNGQGMFDFIDSVVENEGVMSKLSDETQDMLAAWYSGGNESSTAFSDAQDLLDAIEGDLNDAWDAWVQGGKDVPAGMAEGIQAGTPKAVAEAVAMANSIHAAVRRTLEIASPSRKMIALGGYVGLGLAEGIDQSIAQVEAAAARMSVAAERPVAAAAGSTHNNSVTNNHYFTVGEYVQNSESDLNALARRVMGVQRSERQAYGKRK